MTGYNCVHTARCTVHGEPFWTYVVYSHGVYIKYLYTIHSDAEISETKLLVLDVMGGEKATKIKDCTVLQSAQAIIHFVTSFEVTKGFKPCNETQEKI